jgi:hypothetical protein
MIPFVVAIAFALISIAISFVFAYKTCKTTRSYSINQKINASDISIDDAIKYLKLTNL